MSKQLELLHTHVYFAPTHSEEDDSLREAKTNYLEGMPEKKAFPVISP